MIERTTKRNPLPSALVPARCNLLQRNYVCGGTPGLMGEHEESRNKRPDTLQRCVAGRKPDKVPPIVYEVLRSPGQPLEPRFAHDFSRVPTRGLASAVVPADLRVSHVDDRHEAEARASADGHARNPKRDDIGNVRLHTGPIAIRSARAIKALAYTVGNNVVWGAPRQALGTTHGRQVLEHELTHVAQQRRFAEARSRIQRVGIFESIARFFGGGTFTDGELKGYIEGLRGTGHIEDENDSDNKARAVVSKEMFAKEGWEIRALLVEEMLSGFTGGDDRQAILTILGKTEGEDLQRLVDKVGVQRLVDKFSGTDRDKLYVILGTVTKHRQDPVATDWYVGYKARGAEELRPQDFGLVIDQYVATPENDKPTLVAEGATNAEMSGAPMKVAGGLDHPRGKGGSGSIAFHVAPRNADGTVSPAVGAGPKLTESYAPLTLDKRRVTATIDIEYAREKVGEQTTTTAKESERGKEVQTSVKESTGVQTSQQQKQTTGQKTGESRQDIESKGRTETEEKTTGDVSTFTGTVTLGIKVTPEIQAKIQGKAGVQLDGKLLLTLLSAAVGPEGPELMTLLDKAGLLPSIPFTIELGGEVGAKLTVELKGEVALSWSKQHSETFKKGTTLSSTQEQRHGRETEQTSGEERQTGTVSSTGTEATTGQKVSTVERDKTQQAKTSFVSVPIIAKSGVKFDVT